MTRLLVVEDSATQAEELRLILESEGYEVETAPNGATGLERLHRGGFDLVISDVVMPELSGYELCRKIKDDSRTSEVPVVLLTTLSDPVDIIRGLESGADNFLTKPYEPAHLIARVGSVLESGRLRREGSLRAGVDVLFLGRKFLILSEKQQILDLLVSTFEDVVRKNAELAASKAALETANKELEAFSYSVSHDLRAPLRSIDGFSQILLEDYAETLDEIGRGHLVRVRAATQRMAELIDDLLDLSRVSRAGLTRERTKISSLATAVADDLRRKEPDRQVDLSIREGLVVDADSRLLRVVLENLLGNAWKFTSKTPHPLIEFGLEIQGKESVYFVRDNGAGFNMAYAGKLFSPFQRLHGNAEFPGTGIGLATVHRIVDRHGGRVWAEAAVGHGTTIFFTLPTSRLGEAN